MTDLSRVGRVLFWDQQTMMPPAGAVVRGEQRATVARLAHELFTADETGRLLEELRGFEESLDHDSDEASLIRVAREDYEKARRVPSELRAEMARAASDGLRAWAEARSSSDFAVFLPALERNVGLARRYTECFDKPAERYDILLDDYERGMTTAEVRSGFGELKEQLIPFAAELASRDAPNVDACLRQHFPLDGQRAAAHEVVELFGLRPGTWRLDPTGHPFASGGGVDDIRITTRYEDEGLTSLVATMHEYGHALYEHEIAPELDRTPLGAGVSLGLHESQSRLWENLVGRSRPFWRFFYPRLRAIFPDQLGSIDWKTFHRAINRVHPSLIRVEADEVTYNMHVILRFELEQEIVDGRIELHDLPDAWNARLNEYLGIEAPDDAHGVLQDMHWAAGLIGYFPTYSLGNVMSVQIWDRLRADLPDLDDQLERGEFRDLGEWLREHLHRHGRKFSPKETLARVVGGPIDPEPYLRYLREKHSVQP